MGKRKKGGGVTNIITNPPAPPPGLPGGYSPANGATSQAVSLSLSWTAASAATSYDVYFGTTNPPALVSAGQVGLTYATGTTSSGTTYYWRVTAKNSSGSNAGPVLGYQTVSAISTAVLRPTDFTYLGSVLLPQSDGAGLKPGFSTGAISGRVVAGQINLLITQASQQVPTGTDAVMEVQYTGVGTTCPLVTNWGDVTKGKRVTGHGNAAPIRGLHWDTVTSQLFWAYGDAYNSGSPDWDPCIGTSTLTGSSNSGVTAYGPWRLGPEVSQKTRGYLYALPTAIQTALGGGKRIASGAPITSGNVSSPYGAFAAAWAPVANSTAANTTGNNTYAISGTTLIYTDITNPQARIADCDGCGWTHYGETNAFGHQPQLNTTQNGSGCTVDGDLCGVTLASLGPVFNSVDKFTGATWIDGASKQGLVYIGQLARTLAGYTYAGNGRNHVTYGPNQGPGLALCPHGQNGLNYNTGTGESTTTMMSALYIYDPADLLAVANGTKSNIGLVPATDGYDMSLISHSGAAFPQLAGGLYAYGGCWFEPASKLFFVTQTNADVTNPYEPQPIVHVFSVNC